MEVVKAKKIFVHEFILAKGLILLKLGCIGNRVTLITNVSSIILFSLLLIVIINPPQGEQEFPQGKRLDKRSCIQDGGAEQSLFTRCCVMHKVLKKAGRGGEHESPGNRGGMLQGAPPSRWCSQPTLGCSAKRHQEAIRFSLPSSISMTRHMKKRNLLGFVSKQKVNNSSLLSLLPSLKPFLSVVAMHHQVMSITR